MIFASGYIEANELSDVEGVITALKNRNIETGDVKGEKIVFIIERDTSDLVRAELENLKNINGVRNVYLAYFSLEEDNDKDVINKEIY